MILKLLKAAFEKIERQTSNKSDNGRAAHLEHELRENYKISVSAKSLVRYLKEESAPKTELLNKLAEFLDYENYEDYVSKNSGGDKTPKKNLKGGSKLIKDGIRWKARNTWMAFVALIIGNLAYIGLINDEKCMVWVNDHYEKCECTGQALEFELNETELENFRKVSVCDTTKFFEKYDAIIWYDKYNNKMEYFTFYGRNPINGRTLRPITQTIIDNHVQPCDSL
ncbi:hypothetical protein FEE95_14320 [Maribacter algarum]|uniref:Uncharacterized protein n=1 Tax=Maribacter algarum (ex Zhang et al. 2020) TaxID=2578118 RepID=A0A5S3PN17_9FLAO|nr:hypothetical protein [Maribacter algarum]TMM55826.1 hypothetical protein FEE95_14320 [Maribacter algarum]